MVGWLGGLESLLIQGIGAASPPGRKAERILTINGMGGVVGGAVGWVGWLGEWGPDGPPNGTNRTNRTNGPGHTGGLDPGV